MKKSPCNRCRPGIAASLFAKNPLADNWRIDSHPQLSQIHRVMDQEWYARGAGLGHWPYDSFVNFVLRHQPQHEQGARTRILEIGCGTGENLCLAAAEGIDVAG